MLISTKAKFLETWPTNFSAFVCQDHYSSHFSKFTFINKATNQFNSQYSFPSPKILWIYGNRKKYYIKKTDYVPVSQALFMFFDHLKERNTLTNLLFSLSTVVELNKRTTWFSVSKTENWKKVGHNPHH